MKTGLTLGKFAPLHKGHQLLIERALSETDRVIVVIYDAPESTTVPLPVRASWIRQLYPAVEVLEAWNGPAETGATPEIKRVQENYIKQMLAGCKITHFYSSEFYGEHVSRALGAEDCRVDEARTIVPITGTAIRREPFQYRSFLTPCVYRDLVTKVVFVGAPSTGKTTLAAELSRRFRTVWMPEFGREYWQKHQSERRLTRDQLVEIAEGHIEREETLVQVSNGFLFIDTEAITTRMFSLYYHGDAHPRLEQLADEAVRRYDLFFLCSDDIPYEATWDRSGEIYRTVFQKQIRADLLRRKIPFITLSGSLESRIDIVNEILSRFDKFSSPGDQFRK